MGATPMGNVAPPPGGGMGAAPSGGGTPWGKYIGIGCGLLFALSCLGWVGCYACSMMASSAATSAIPTVPSGGGVAPAPVPAGGGGGSVCQRAVDCCNAYAATPLGASVASTCANYATPGMPDMGCQSAIDGFRAGLQATGQAVPPACQ
jgi:hypothetical protein